MPLFKHSDEDNTSSYYRKDAPLWVHIVDTLSSPVEFMMHVLIFFVIFGIGLEYELSKKPSQDITPKQASDRKKYRKWTILCSIVLLVLLAVYGTTEDRIYAGKVFIIVGALYFFYINKELSSKTKNTYVYKPTIVSSNNI
jgi:hypothetical protein